MDCSHSTIDRALRDLRDAELVTYINGVWKPTLLGQCCYNVHEKYLSYLTNLSRAAPLLTPLPCDSLVGCEFLNEANVHKSDPSMPDAVIQVLFDSVEQATEVYVATPSIITGFAEDFYNCLRWNECYSMEIILPEDVFNQIREMFPHLIYTVMNDSNVSLYQTSIPFNFGLWIADFEEAGIVIFTDQGVQGILVNDTDDALNWAEEQYKQVKENADQIFSVW